MEHFQPDIIAYSVTSESMNLYRQINNTLKERYRFFAVFGGPHPTFSPALISEDGVEAICRGEGDLSFPMFVNAFGTDDMWQTPNMSVKTDQGQVVDNPMLDLVDNLDGLPFPDRDSVYRSSAILRENPVKSFFAGRGCPFKCSYCFNHAYNKMYQHKGRIVRLKSVEYLINEIELIKSKHPLTMVRFYDDIFGHNLEWLAEFASSYPKEIGLPFICYARPNMISEKFCMLLKKAGCRSVMTAIECGNEEYRKAVLKRNISNKQIIESLRLLKSYGIKIFSLNMVGLPEEQVEDMFGTIELNRASRVDYACASIFQPYPGTEIYDYCLSKGLLPPDGVPEFQGFYSTTILNLPLSQKNQINLIQKFFAIFVDFPNSVKLFPTLKKIPGLKWLWALIYRAYYGVNVYRKIYGVQFSLSFRIRSAVYFFISRNKT